ncbi:expressed unknown protein [Seminavis robusta]|uniref:Uncharacterized protein n=1 Tax=Seminavis robusta TaxID=568900 RepID=A0A9N8E8K2_9STRA|nr:expressed unknown protein [Seminavis robusta]|eukprot:Sro667_g184170.1 n/a (554) ;mRNA; f:26832-28493
MVFNSWDDDDALYHEYGKVYGERYDDYDTQYRTNLARPFAALSLLGSIFIIQDILRQGPLCANNRQCQKKQRTRNRTVQQRSQNTIMCHKIMLGLSISDTITSTMYLLGTVLVPHGQAWGAHGTRETCTMQGFLIWYFNPCSRMYSGTLAICYVLMVRYAWTEDQLARWFVQLALLGFPHVIAILVALPLLIDQSFNFDQVSVCGPSTYPTWCKRFATPETVQDGQVVCIRGGHLSVGGTKVGTTAFKIMAPIDMYLAGIIITVSMMVLYWTVRAREWRNRRYAFPGTATTPHNNSNNNNPPSSSNSSSSNSWIMTLPRSFRPTFSLLQSSAQSSQPPLRSSVVGIQGVCFCLAYWCAVGPFFVLMTIFWFGLVPYKSRPDWLSPLIVVTLPSQGFFNALVYLRPRIMEWCCQSRRPQAQQPIRQPPSPPANHSNGQDTATNNNPANQSADTFAVSSSLSRNNSNDQLPFGVHTTSDEETFVAEDSKEKNDPKEDVETPLPSSSSQVVSSTTTATTKETTSVRFALDDEDDCDDDDNVKGGDDAKNETIANDA